MVSTHRTQVLLSQSTQDRVQHLATESKRSMSAMCSELIEYALMHGDKYKIDQQNMKQNTVEALYNGAVLDDTRMQKLLKLLDAIE